MGKWFGAAGVCINENNQLLMVLQGKPEEIKTWSIPSGGLEKDETYEECCKREIQEETGYLTEVVSEIKVKKGCYEKIKVSYEVYYYIVRIIGGEKKIQDPDNLIYDIAWKSLEEIRKLELTYSEDRELLLESLKNNPDSYSTNG